MLIPVRGIPRVARNRRACRERVLDIMTSGNSPNCVGLDANSEDNVREYANLNKPFLDSIADHGVLQPITAIRRADGVVEVRNGQRRTMAARKLGLSSIPVGLRRARHRS